MEYPELRTPPPPEKAIIDGDSILFKAAQAGETTWYVAVGEDGEEITRFDSAHNYKNWLETAKEFGLDVEHGYEGDLDKVERKVEYEIHDVEKCYKAFDKIVREWVRASGCEDYVVYIGKKSGAKVFRYDVATIYPYKHGRDDLKKPHHLEAVRKYARNLPNVTTVKGDIEVDDKVVAEAEKHKHRACLCALDKDSLQARGCYIHLVGQHEEPVFSSKKIVGRLWQEDKKIYGTGYLFTAFQMLKGDKPVDGIVGLPKWGDKKAYEALKKFDGVGLTHLSDVIYRVAELYYSVYGDEHKYNHCYTNEEITATWRDMFEENLRLLWMKRHRDDVGQSIMEHVPDVGNLSTKG
jgi:hypothetical protein